MRTLIVTALLGAGFVAAAAAQAPVAQPVPPPADTTKPKVLPKIDISKLKFLSGCWQVKTGKDSWAEEIWTTPSDNLYLSVTRYFTKDQATTYDFNRIEVTDSGVVMGVRPKGKEEAVYLMKTLVDEYVVFENFAKKDFPQRISYRLASDGALIPRNEGEGPSFEVRLNRVKCPGADIKLRP